MLFTAYCHSLEEIPVETHTERERDARSYQYRATFYIMFNTVLIPLIIA